MEWWFKDSEKEEITDLDELALICENQNPPLNVNKFKACDSGGRTIFTGRYYYDKGEHRRVPKQSMFPDCVYIIYDNQITKRLEDNPQQENWC